MRVDFDEALHQCVAYTSVFSTVAAPLAALSSLLSSKESCVVCLSPVEPENAVSMRLGTP